MRLEQALSGNSMQAYYHHSSGGNTIVDASWTFRNPHCKDEETYWVQQPNRIVRQDYHSLDEVREVISHADSDEWETLPEEAQ